MFLSSTLFSILVTKRQRLSCSLWFFLWRTSNVIIKNQIISCVQIYTLPHLSLHSSSWSFNKVSLELIRKLVIWLIQSANGNRCNNSTSSAKVDSLFFFFSSFSSLFFFCEKKIQDERIWWIRKYKFKSLGPKVTNRKSKSVRDEKKILTFFIEIPTSIGSDHTFCALSMDWYSCIVNLIYDSCHLCWRMVYYCVSSFVNWYKPFFNHLFRMSTDML